MNDVTRILNQIEQGNSSASDKLLPLVYEELRCLARQRLASEKPGQTLQATALVHEAYLRLVARKGDSRWDSRGHFFAAAANAMRRILVEAARRKLSTRHGGKLQRVDAELEQLPAGYAPDEVINVDRELERLRIENPDVAQLVELKYFAGFRLAEIAEQRNISLRTAHRHWAYAKAWLRQSIEQDAAPT